MDSVKSHGENQGKKTVRGSRGGGLCYYPLGGKVHFMEKVTFKRNLKEPRNEGNEDFPS